MDDHFQPVVHDAKGKPLKALPKPGANDDAGKAAAATNQLKDLRKLAKSVATAQQRRLEAAMCARRRWAPTEFLPFFANHPVLRVFSRRLVWGLFDTSNRLAGTFRIGAEGELTDLQGAPVQLVEDARIGIPHPLEMAALDPSLAAAWADVLAGHGIVQAFEQLARQTFARDDSLRARRDIPHWAGRQVSNAALMGLEQRGWLREVGEGGMVDSFGKRLPGGRRVRLRLGAGWFVQDSPDGADGSTLGDLSPVDFSEIERDLQRAVRPAAESAG